MGKEREQTQEERFILRKLAELHAHVESVTFLNHANTDKETFIRAEERRVW